MLDGLLGYRGRGEPRGLVRDSMAWASDTAAPVMSLDLPSGLGATSGGAASPAIRASATVTLAALKTGLTVAASAPYVGELYLADIGIPAAARDGLGDAAAAAAWFLDDDVVRVRWRGRCCRGAVSPVTAAPVASRYEDAGTEPARAPRPHGGRSS